MNDYRYTATDYFAEIDVDDYINRFRDYERFTECCSRCEVYGTCWGCPPFDTDTEGELRQWRRALLIATKIVPLDKDIPLSEVRELIRPERARLENRLLEMEKEYDGHSYAYVGHCLYCPEGTCTRPQGLPCRHPELVRPSLEAYGFDICRTADELFGIKICWGKGGHLPEYLTLVCGFFHNCDTTPQF